MRNNNKYIGIAVIVLIFGIIVIPKIYKRLAGDDVARGGRMHKVGGELEKEDPNDLVYINIGGVDRKVPAFSFVDQYADTITNKSYYGKVFLVEFFFTRCTDICIPMSHNLQVIAKEFEGNDNFGIASFSIDPEHDTSEVLKKYAEDYGVTNPNWHFMTGERDEIRKLSNEGFYLATNEIGDTEKELYHSGLFALIDQNGFIRSRLDSYGNPKPYYRGSVPLDQVVPEGGEQPEIDILMEDIQKLLAQ
jgi:protein SCO1/2